MWVADTNPGWIARHKIVFSIGVGLLGLLLLLCLIGAVAGSPPEETAANPIGAAPPTVTANANNAADDKAAADKAAADKAAADKAAADKAAAERALPPGTDCESLADEAVRISAASTNDVKVIKVRVPKALVDNRQTFKVPTGSNSVLVMSCTGEAVASTGEEGLPILIKLTVDSDGEYFVSYEDR